MAYFPFFVDIENRKGVVIGGGKVALRKVKNLIPFGARLTVIAPEFLEEFYALEDVSLLEQEFCEELLEDAFFVITATNDKKLNEYISRICKEKGILVNSADGREESSFIFPALVRRGKLVVGISSSGSSPSAAAEVKDNISEILPENIDDILEWLEKQREAVLTGFPKDKRKLAMKGLYALAIELGRLPDERESSKLLTEVMNGK